MRARRVIALLAVAFLALAGCDRSPSVPNAPAPTPRVIHGGFYIQMPSKASSPDDNPQGGAVLTLTSNLPSGTRAYIVSDIPGVSFDAPVCCPAFVESALRFHQPAYCGPGEPKADLSRGFNVLVVVVPDISLIHKDERAACKSITECSAGPTQPQAVQRVLGRNFERLASDNATTILGTPALVASAHYAWPEDACTEPLDIASGAPRICRPTTASILDDTGGQDYRGAPGGVTGPLSQELLCDLYNYTTAAFQKANPWLRFRDRAKKWIKTHSPLMGKGGFLMTSRILEKGPETVGIAKSPQWLEVDYFLRGKKVAHARIIATKWYSGYTKWDIADLDLL